MERVVNNVAWLRFCVVIVGWFPLAVAITLVATNPTSAAEKFPFTAVIATIEASVRSGPSTDFYATEKLAKGSEVEVYRRDASDWYAIRPPNGSFSWVAAQHLELTEDPLLARVINVPVKTRIGSRFSDVHDVEYISLRKGEVVEILGSKKLRSDDVPAERWFRISPPAGEFRWVHADDIKPKSSREPVTEVSVGSDTIETFDLPSGDGKQEDVFSEAKVSDVDHLPPAAGSTETVRAVSYYDDPIAPAPDTAVELREGDSTHVNTVTWQAVAEPADVLSAPEPRTFQDRFGALNVMLSRAVLDEIEEWQFGNVERQAKLLREQANNSEEEDLAEALLAKVQEFQDLKARNARLASSPSHLEVIVAQRDERTRSTATPGKLPPFESDARIPTGPEMPRQVTTVAATATKVGSGLRQTEVVDNSVFDATGLLIAVQSRRADVPKFALTDTRGKITQFVSPNGRTTLNRYLNQRVGILGDVGYVRKLNKMHVVANKVVALKR